MKGDYSRFDFVHRHWRAKHYSGVQTQQGRVTPLDSEWNEQLDIQRHLDETTRRDVIGPSGAPEGRAGFAISVTPGLVGTMRLSAGRYYVDGILCENEATIPITEQPHLPGFQLPREPGFYVVYLDVWQRHITALEDPEIREVALGGPDTATRVQTVWRVELERVDPADPEDPPPTCAQFGPGWQPREIPATPSFLRARTVPDPDSDEPCIVPAQAGYRRLENQLYRVEIHDGSDAPGGPTFKWSQDNGIVVSRVVAIDGQTLTVSDPGRDRLSGFDAGQWVEISDETRALSGRPGVLARLTSVTGSRLTVEEWPNGAPPTLADHPTVRRWDSPGAIAVGTGTWVPLEAGVEVELRGPFRSGDYWTIPARTNIGDVLWPAVPATGEPAAEERQGIRHHYCALAILSRSVLGWGFVSDCRRRFPVLTGLPVGAGPAGPAFVDVLRIADNAPLQNDQVVQAALLAGGLRLEVDGDVPPGLVTRGTIFVELDLPFPLSPQDREFWGGALVGYQPLVLEANLQTNRGSILWLPAPATATWLRARLFDRVGDDTRVLARLTCGRPFDARAIPSWFWLVRAPAGQPPPDLPIVNVNTATEAELMTLSGIGVVLARAIVMNRPYGSVEELAQVPGLRRSVLNALRPRLVA